MVRGGVQVRGAVTDDADLARGVEADDGGHGQPPPADGLGESQGAAPAPVTRTA